MLGENASACDRGEETQVGGEIISLRGAMERVESIFSDHRQKLIPVLKQPELPKTGEDVETELVPRASEIRSIRYRLEILGDLIRETTRLTEA